MRKNATELTELINPTITALGFELLGCSFVSQGRYSTLRIYIDSPQGVTLDDCQLISRQIGAVLDVEDPIASGYSLEVSSPGLDRPLFKPEHYARFIGQKAQLRLHAPVNGQRKFKGVIQAVSDKEIVLVIEGEEEGVSLPLASIDKANLVPEF